MQFKTGVVWRDMHPAVIGAQDILDRVHQKVAQRDAIVTAARDGKHKSGSHHYEGRALDLRTNDLPAAKWEELRQALHQQLGAAWDVILEVDHIHVEYDPKI